MIGGLMQLVAYGQLDKYISNYDETSPNLQKSTNKIDKNDLDWFVNQLHKVPYYKAIQWIQSHIIDKDTLNSSFYYSIYDYSNSYKYYYSSVLDFEISRYMYDGSNKIIDFLIRSGARINSGICRRVIDDMQSAEKNNDWTIMRLILNSEYVHIQKKMITNAIKFNAPPNLVIKMIDMYDKTKLNASVINNFLHDAIRKKNCELISFLLEKSTDMDDFDITSIDSLIEFIDLETYRCIIMSSEYVLSSQNIFLDYKNILKKWNIWDQCIIDNPLNTLELLLTDELAQYTHQYQIQL